MKAFHVVAALAAVSAGGATVLPAQVATRVTAPLAQRSDTATVRIFARVTNERLREMSREIAEIAASNKRRETLLLKVLGDSTQSWRAAALQDELATAALELMSKQRELHVACLVSRPDDEFPGTLGIDIEGQEGVRWIRERHAGANGSLTMVFGATLPRVKSIAAGSPAERAGMQPGDVWRSVNGRMLTGHVRFDELLNPGSRVVMRVERGGRDVELQAVAVAAKRADGQEMTTDVCEEAREYAQMSAPLLERVTVQGQRVDVGSVTLPLPARAPQQTMQVFVMPTNAVYGGATLQPMDDEWRSVLGVNLNGVVVTDISPGTPASAAGLQKFDIVTRVNGIVVTSPQAFRSISAANRVLELVVTSRDGATRVVKLAR